ncbi:hypothetical protein EV360DRAFT_70284 [Lentinula raphanica]|nr:hypothetical protein EV360DRAFT_70284 [Lentinula raphanica]
MEITAPLPLEDQAQIQTVEGRGDETQSPESDTQSSSEVLDLKPTATNPFHNRVIVRDHRSIFHQAMSLDGCNFDDPKWTKNEEREWDSIGEQRDKDQEAKRHAFLSCLLFPAYEAIQKTISRPQRPMVWYNQDRCLRRDPYKVAVQKEAPPRSSLSGEEEVQSNKDCQRKLRRKASYRDRNIEPRFLKSFKPNDHKRLFILIPSTVAGKTLLNPIHHGPNSNFQCSHRFHIVIHTITAASSRPKHPSSSTSSLTLPSQWPNDPNSYCALSTRFVGLAQPRRRMDRVTCMHTSITVADGRSGWLTISNGGGGNGTSSVLVTIGSGWSLLLRRGGVEQSRWAHLSLELECSDLLKDYCPNCRKRHIEKFEFSDDWFYDWLTIIRPILIRSSTA